MEVPTVLFLTLRISACLNVVPSTLHSPHSVPLCLYLLNPKPSASSFMYLSLTLPPQIYEEIVMALPSERESSTLRFLFKRQPLGMGNDGMNFRHLAAARRKNWPQGFVMECRVQVAEGLDLGKYQIGALGFCVRSLHWCCWALEGPKELYRFVTFACAIHSSPLPGLCSPSPAQTLGQNLPEHLARPLGQVGDLEGEDGSTRATQVLFISGLPCHY